MPFDELTTLPEPLEIIELAMPADAEGLAPQTGVIALHLDEHGHVVDVTSDTEHLASAYLASARTAFLGTRFSQALKQGRAAKTVMRIEIDFHTTGAWQPPSR